MHLVTSPDPSKASTGVGLPDPQSRALGFQCRAADETWFAKVLLIFTYHILSKRGPQPALFVRWNCAAPATQLTSLTGMQAAAVGKGAAPRQHSHHPPLRRHLC